MFSYETKYFLAIASAQNLNRAAQDLFVSPSALSQFLSKLEKKVGAPLFVRGGDSLQLTEVGVIFLDAARQVEQIKIETTDLIRALSAKNHLELRIGSATRRALRFASFLLPIFQNQYPSCSISLSHDLSAPIYDMVKNSTLDFGIVHMDSSLQDYYQFQFLSREEMCLFIPRNHRIDQELRDQGISPNDPVDISVCRGETIILNTKNSFDSNKCMQYFKQERFTPQRIIHSFISSYSELIRISPTVGMFPSGFAPDTDDIVVQRLKNPPYYDLAIMFRKDRKLSELDNNFLALAKAYKDRY